MSKLMDSNKLDICLHCTPWEIKNIIADLDKIKEWGYTTIQIVPIQKCKVMWDDGGRLVKGSTSWYTQLYKDWWNLYQPMGYEVGNFMVKEEEVKELYAGCKARGIKLIIDVVLRHTAGDNYGNLIPHEDVDPDLRNNPYFWLHPFVISDYKDRNQLIWGTMEGLPALNYDNLELQQQKYIPFIRHIAEYCDGIRIDMAKHYRLPSEGGTFFQNVIMPLKEELGILVYGECPDIPRDKLLEYQACGVIPIIPYEQSWGLTDVQCYVESHDTFLSTQITTVYTPEYVMRLWEDMLDHVPNGCGVVHFPRRDDPNVYSPKMKEVNNRRNHR